MQLDGSHGNGWLLIAKSHSKFSSIIHRALFDLQSLVG